MISIIVVVTWWLVLMGMVGMVGMEGAVFWRPPAPRAAAPPADWPQCPPPPAACRPHDGLLDDSYLQHYKYTVEGELLLVYRHIDAITVSCKQNASLLNSNSLPSFLTRQEIRHVRFKYCDVPADSYAAVLHRLNITVSHVLELYFYAQCPAFTKMRFKGLTIKSLSTYCDRLKDQMANFSGDWLEPLTELTHFYGAHVRLPPLYSPNQLSNVTVWGSTISGGYCGRLQNLSLIDVTWEGAASTWSWLASCTHLRYLKLDNIFKKRTTSSGADTLEYSDLKWMGERRLQLTLSNVQSISYNMSHYWEVVRGNCTELAVNISVRGSVRCDWRTYWFARTLQACPRHVVWGAVPSCTQLYARVPLPANLTSVRPEHMLRPLKEEHMCADGCNCYWSQEEGSGVVADCSRRALTRPPVIPRLVLLHAGGNYIHTIHRDYLNDTLLELDLRNNNISVIPAEVCARLFSVPERLVMLAGNPLQCDCDNQPLLRELLHHRDQVDYQHLKCGDGKLLSTIDVQMLCLIGKEIYNTKETQLLNMIRKEIYIVLSLLLLAAGYVYSDKLKELIRLCRRKLCQCCMRE